MKFLTSICAAAFALALPASVAAEENVAPPPPTAPSYETLSVIVPASSTSNPITLPVANKPILMIITNETVGNRGIAQVTIQRVNPVPFLEWVGMDIYTGAISDSFSGTAGTHIIYADYGGGVDVQVHSATQIQLVNSYSSAEKVVISMIY